MTFQDTYGGKEEPTPQNPVSYPLTSTVCCGMHTHTHIYKYTLKTKNTIENFKHAPFEGTV